MQNGLKCKHLGVISLESPQFTTQFFNKYSLCDNITFCSVLSYWSFYGQFVCLLFFKPFGWTDEKWWHANQRILQSTIRHAFEKLTLGRIHCLCPSRLTGDILYSSLFSSLLHHPNQCCGVTHKYGPQYRSWGHLSWHLGTLQHWLGWCIKAKSLPFHFSFVTVKDLRGWNVLHVNYCLATYSLKNHSHPLSGP